MLDKIILTVDKDVLNEYFKHYKKQHPRARKNPISNYYHPSINQWAIYTRMKANKIKQDYKDFIVWLVCRSGYKDYPKIEECTVDYNIYFENRIRRDNDNYTPKFIMDGITQSGLWIDDDSKHVTKLTISCKYDKKHPRSEIIISVFKFEEEIENEN